mgnify:CR=1 FL=1
MILRLILSDQLNESISSLSDLDPKHDLIKISEVWDQATFVKHHKKKLVLIFSSMRHFSEELRSKGFKVKYTKLDDPSNPISLFSELKKEIRDSGIKKVVVTEPSEYHLLQEIKSWESRLGIPVEIRSDDRFYCTHEDFNYWASDRKQLRMEYFYRMMRKKNNILMNGENPEGGAWNYDVENRKVPDKSIKIPKCFESDVDQTTVQVISMVEKMFPEHFGDLEPFHFGVTREQALEALEHFINISLPSFGVYQDAMLEDEKWMFHSHLSFYLNCGLLLPHECVEKVAKAFYEKKAPLNSVEGFIRQVLGWREYIRGIYWLKMPAYQYENFFQAAKKLPDFFWTGNTQMNCLKQCIRATKETAYAHHIQRLMIIGNFSLLAGLDPTDVNEWFLIVYADAYQWVELPNVSGMVLFADGGYLASKPYAAGGAYINRMSNYCRDCHYKVSQKNGAAACPFNYLYWDFLIRNRAKLKDNARLGMMYRSLDRMDETKIVAIRHDANQFLASLPET